MAKEIQKIEMLCSSDGSHRTYFTVGTRVCMLPYAIFDHPFEPEKHPTYDYIGELGQQLVSELMEIDGVRKLFLQAESVQVDREYFHSWKTIQPDIDAAFEKALGRRPEIGRDVNDLNAKAMEMAGA